MSRSDLVLVRESAEDLFPADPCPWRACEYELADTGRVLGRVLPGWCLVVLGDSLRA